MRHRIESVDLTQKINNVAVKIDNIEDKFHRLREDCAANIFRKLEVKMGNLRQDDDHECKEQDINYYIKYKTGGQGKKSQRGCGFLS